MKDKKENLSLDDLYKLHEAYRHFNSMHDFVRAINELIAIREKENKSEAIQDPRKPAELKIAELANKFYERYPLTTFKSDGERAEAFGYFMAGAELQCFGEFVKYEDLCGDE